MKVYFAPLEGITDEILRNAYIKYYGNIEKYFTPFLSSKSIKNFTKRDSRLIGINTFNVVPQILSKDAKETIDIINSLKEIGINEVNLNFGCPSLTVTKKNKGAGIFNDLIHLDSYLKEIFDKTDIKISIKTRLGINDINEFDKILEIYKKYPIYELIIHPRVGSEFYKGSVHLDSFEKAINSLPFKVVYNGDISSKEDINYILNRFKEIDTIMLGRSLLRCPSLLHNDMGEEELRQRFLSFYLEIIDEHYKLIGANSTLFYMKELWFYFKDYFIDSLRDYQNLIKIKDYLSFKNYSINLIKNLRLNLYPKNNFN